MCAKTFSLIMLGTGATFGLVQSTSALTIVSGSNYLTTVSGTYIDFGFFGSPLGLGVVAFEGEPTGPGNTDTIIERQGDGVLNATGDTATIDIELVALGLKSVSPVDVGGTFYDIEIGLSQTIPSPGQMEITLDSEAVPSGTFTSFFDVFVELALIDHDSGLTTQTVTGLPAVHVEGSGHWSSVAPPNALLLPGAPGDRTANVHEPLATGFFDLYIDDLLFVPEPDEAAMFNARTSIIPEPGTAMIFCLGALGMGLHRRWHQGSR